MCFDYAHFNTANGERETPTAQFNKVKFDDKLESILRSSCEREIPVSDRETLTFIVALVSALRPQTVLEIGTATGVSAAAMLSACPSARVTTIEKNEKFYSEASENFKNLGITQHVTAILGDAADVLSQTEGEFDFIFLDCAKAQYVKYLPRLKRLLKRGGTLLADDVLLFGYVSGEAKVPPKRKMLVRHIKEYIEAVTCDAELSTAVINVGNGLAMSVKK